MDSEFSPLKAAPEQQGNPATDGLNQELITLRQAFDLFRSMKVEARVRVFNYLSALLQETP